MPRVYSARCSIRIPRGDLLYAPEQMLLVADGTSSVALGESFARNSSLCLLDYGGTTIGKFVRLRLDLVGSFGGVVLDATVCDLCHDVYSKVVGV